jgi:hypothetical protein
MIVGLLSMYSYTILSSSYAKPGTTDTTTSKMEYVQKKPYADAPHNPHSASLTNLRDDDIKHHQTGTAVNVDLDTSGAIK